MFRKFVRGLGKNIRWGRFLKTVTAYSAANGEREAEGIEIDNSMIAQGTLSVTEDARA
jgi:hypothetical protein